MNIIEEKYRVAKKLLGWLKKFNKERDTKVILSIETVHYIVPQNDNGINVSKILHEVHRTLEEKYTIIITEFARDIDTDGIEEQIAKSMTMSKRNINKILTDNKITDGGGIIPENIMQSLIKDSQPQ